MGKFGMAKLSQAIEKVEKYFSNRKARKQAIKEAKIECKNLINAIKKSDNPSDFLKTDNTKQEEKQEATKTETRKSSVQTVLRHFLKVASNKKDVTKDLQKITKGKKVNWKKATSGLKNWYVSSIENMPSKEVDEVMAQYKNYNEYFNKGTWTAKIWSSQK